MVNYVGLSELELPAAEERHARIVVERHMLRVHTLGDDVIDARVRIKRIWKGGGTARYEVSVSILTNAGPRYAASSSWTLATALHNAFESVENQLAVKRDIERLGRTEAWNYPHQAS